jgi:hypothetical protein
MIIDAHVHAFPDALAERALASLSERAGMLPPKVEGTIAALEASMQEAQIDSAWIANIATRPNHAAKILEWCQAIRAPRILPLGSLHPKSQHWEQELEAIALAGLPGIKLHPLYQGFSADDPSMLPLYRLAAKLGLFILFHAGFDIAYPNDDNASPVRLARIRDKVDDLLMIAAHLGGWNAWEDVLDCLCGSDVYFDTSFMHDATVEQRERIFANHDCRRILFGSDSPWLNQLDCVNQVKALPLSDEERRGVLGGNALALVGRANGREFDHSHAVAASHRHRP